MNSDDAANKFIASIKQMATGPLQLEVVKRYIWVYDGVRATGYLTEAEFIEKHGDIVRGKIEDSEKVFLE